MFQIFGHFFKKVLTCVPIYCTILGINTKNVPNIWTIFKSGEKMTAPSLRKLENDLDVNKTTLHNWKKNRPKLYEFIIESYKDRELLKKNLQLMIAQREVIEEEITITQERVTKN